VGEFQIQVKLNIFREGLKLHYGSRDWVMEIEARIRDFRGRLG
jgi:hypothetical protein